MQKNPKPTPLCMVWPTREGIPEFGLAAGVALRAYRPGDERHGRDCKPVRCVRAPKPSGVESMSQKSPTQRPKTELATGATLEKVVQVVLHNDDHNAMEYVVLCLMKVFTHPITLATKIMMEAHRRGRAIAEVEAESRAQKHRNELQSLGLMATVEKL